LSVTQETAHHSQSTLSYLLRVQVGFYSSSIKLNA